MDNEELNENLENEELTEQAQNQAEETQGQETETEEIKTEPEIDFEAKIKELEHDLAVVRADFYNFRQRSIKERQETRTRAKEDALIEFLPVLDNLDRALSASNEDPSSIIKGVEMVHRQFVNALENLGVSAINAKGETFDPSLHDAAGTEQVEDPELDGKVMNVMLTGWRSRDRVLRPAQVTVGKIS